MFSITSLTLLTALAAGKPPSHDSYYDFRGGKPLPPDLTLYGRNAAQFVRPEPEGLRVTPPTDGSGPGWGVESRYTVSGDFEITGSYEIIDVGRPTSGNGNGVAINALPEPGRNYAKIGRFWLPNNTNVYVAQIWDRDNQEAKHWTTSPTSTRTGKLRLTRKGSTTHHLAADSLDGDFHEIATWEWRPDDLTNVRFFASNGSPWPLDIRLLDLKVSGKFDPVAATIGSVVDPPEGKEPKSRNFLFLIWGAFAALIATALAVRLVMRRSSKKSAT